MVHTTLTKVQEFGHLLKGTSEAREMGIIQKVGPVFLVFNKETRSNFGTTYIKKRAGTCLQYRSNGLTFVKSIELLASLISSYKLLFWPSKRG